MSKFLRLSSSLLGCMFCLGCLQAQNLVLNPSFELTQSCPQGISEFYLCTDWSTTTTTPSDSCSTPDLYAACSSVIGGVNVPNCLLGYHQARTGTHFAGIILGDGIPGLCLSAGDDYREYIEGTLSTPLIAGQKYLVLFYASLADASMWGSNSLGVHFTDTKYVHDACPNSIINVTPQLEMCGPAIMDTVNWIPVQWIYTATGGEQYLTIGNFNNDANTNRVDHDCSSFNPYIYYYIDDVSVTPYGTGDSSSPANHDCGVTIETDSVNATCGASDGSIAASVSGCSTPFIYQWSNGGTASSIQNIPAGLYTLSVTDVNNCLETVSVSVNSETLLLGETATNPGCGSNNGSITITPSNGTGPFNYAWSNSESTSTISNLGAGEYTVTVTGAPGCTAVDSLSLLGASAITITPAITNAGCSGNNGSITANISGGAGPYTYSWSSGQTTQTITGLAPGNYIVTALGDTSGTVVWSENFSNGGTGWTLNTAGTGSNGGDANQWVVNNDNTCQCTSGKYLHITCNSASFYCLLQGGTCTYLEFPSDLGFGDYTTDELAISPVISTVGKSNLTLSFTYLSLGNPGQDYGLVDLSNDGGNTWTALPTQYQNVSNCTQANISIPIAYQNISNFRIAFEWINSGGSITGNLANPPGFAIDSISLIAAGSDCPAVANATVGETSNISVTLNPTQPTCGQNNGAVYAQVDSGTGPFTYAWNTGDTTQTISNLGTGLYLVTVTGTGGCSSTANISLFSNNTLALTVSESAASCGNSDGSASVAVLPHGTYEYLWNNSDTTSTISNIAGGVYEVTVTGQGGCLGIDSVVVSSSGTLAVTNNTTNATCGQNNGIASVSVNPQGAYSYIWNNGATTSSISNLAGATYMVTITGGGCLTIDTIQIIASSSITVLDSTSNTTCGLNNGAASVSPTPQGSYSYLWSNGATTSGILNLPGATYTVTITGQGGCSSVDTVQINPSDSISVFTSVTGTSCGHDNGAALVSASGGSGALSYLWNNGSTSVSLNNLPSGTYVVTVSDASGCKVTDSVIVNASGNTPVQISAGSTTICSGDSTQICAPPGYASYSWNNSDTSNCITVSLPGNYYLTVTDNGNCTASSTKVTIQIYPTQPVSLTITGDTIVVDTGSSYGWYLNDTLLASVNSNQYIAQQSGEYIVAITDANGCTSYSNPFKIVVTGISQLFDNSFVNVYPNPSSSLWQMDLSEDWLGGQAELFDNNGRLVSRFEINRQKSEIDVNVERGVYILRLSSQLHTVNFKLVKI